MKLDHCSLRFPDDKLSLEEYTVGSVPHCGRSQQIIAPAHANMGTRNLIIGGGFECWLITYICGSNDRIFFKKVFEECKCVVLCFSTCIWTARTRVRLYFFVQNRLHVFEGMWIPLSDSSEILENVQWALRKSARTLRPVARFREIYTFMMMI